ncbi:hypothetical protein SPURM210S_03310 [Streptomyces purpurascens]
MGAALTAVQVCVLTAGRVYALTALPASSSRWCAASGKPAVRSTTCSARPGRSLLPAIVSQSSVSDPGLRRGMRSLIPDDSTGS